MIRYYIVIKQVKATNLENIIQYFILVCQKYIKYFFSLRILLHLRLWLYFLKLDEYTTAVFRV